MNKEYNNTNNMATNEELTEPLLNRSSQNEDDEVPETHRKSRNINYVLFYTFFAFCGRSLWNQSVLPAFVYLIKDNDPVSVGLVTAIMGISQLLTSFPSAYFADRFRRDIVLKVGSLVGVVAAILLIVATMHENFLILGIALAFWGLFWGISNTSLSALFADSIQDGDRAYYFTNRSVLLQLGNSFGPLVAFVMFTWMGDDWTIKECAYVISSAQVFCIPALSLLCLMNDDYCIPIISEDESNGMLGEENSTEEIDCVSSIDGIDLECNSGIRVNGNRQLESENSLSGLSDNISEHRSETRVDDSSQTAFENSSSASSELVSLSIIPAHKVIPVIVATCDILGGLGAGMSIRYFAIFFLDNLKLPPATVQLIYLISTLSMAVSSKVAQHIGKSVGRIQTVVVFKWTGLLFLFGMVSSYKNNFPVEIVCIFFVLRTAVMNGTGALTRSVLMDEVPRNERAKWSALESVNMVGWAGSAVLGGFIIEKESILFNFCFTGLIQFLATIPFLYLFGKVK